MTSSSWVLYLVSPVFIRVHVIYSFYKNCLILFDKNRHPVEKAPSNELLKNINKVAQSKIKSIIVAVAHKKILIIEKTKCLLVYVHNM